MYEDIAKDVQTRIRKKVLPGGKNNKVVKLMEDELRVKLMTKFAALEPRT